MTSLLAPPRYRPVPETSCQQSLDNWGWAATSTFSVGELDLGVRSSSGQLDEAVRQLLAPELRADLKAPANYSLFQAPRAEPGDPQRLHELFEGCASRWRARSAAELVTVLLLQLEGQRLRQQSEVIALSAVVLVTAAGAVVVPTGYRQPFLEAAPILRRDGALLWPACTVGLDPSTGEIVLPAPALALDGSAWPAIARLDNGPPRELPVPGRYPLAGWLPLLWRPPERPMTRGQAVLGAYPAIVNLDLIGAERALRALARAVAAPLRPLLIEGDTRLAIRRAVLGR
ncbi:MAG: hypothetical protein ABR549_07760 [Mycobacteriales bacterium]